MEKRKIRKSTSTADMFSYRFASGVERVPLPETEGSGGKCEWVNRQGSQLKQNYTWGRFLLDESPASPVNQRARQRAPAEPVCG